VLRTVAAAQTNAGTSHQGTYTEIRQSTIACRRWKEPQQNPIIDEVNVTSKKHRPGIHPVLASPWSFSHRQETAKEERSSTRLQTINHAVAHPKTLQLVAVTPARS
jgi:hypothetical protein